MCANNAFEWAWKVPWLPQCSTLLKDPSSFILQDHIVVSKYSDPTGQGEHWQSLPVNACYTQEMKQSCTVEASTILLGVVVACITCKTLCMFWILWLLKETPLVVLGDAIASFMTSPDKHTKEACLAPPSAFTKGKPWHMTRKWSCKAERWMSNVSRGQWTTCMLMYALRSYDLKTS